MVITIEMIMAVVTGIVTYIFGWLQKNLTGLKANIYLHKI